MTSVRLPENIELQLESLCKITKRTKSFYIKEALERYLEDTGDQYIALNRIASPGRLLTGEELLKELDGES